MDTIPRITNHSFIYVKETDRDNSITPLVSFTTYRAFLLINSFGLTSIVAIFGVFSNTLNIIVFLRMGLRETTNVGFFALAVVDWLVSVCSFLSVAARLPEITFIGESTISLTYYLVGVMFPCLGLGAWVTAVLSVERCICIVIPLKVKTIVTRRRTLCLISGMAVYEVVLGGLILTTVHTPYSQPNPARIALLLYFYSISVFTCFSLVLISSIFIIIRLKKALQWRASCSTSTRTSGGGVERKVVLSVLWICIMFIACFTPMVVMFVAAFIHPRFVLLDPYYGWLVHVIFTFSYLFQTVSSALNILVYYNMSTKFRVILNGLLAYTCEQNEQQKS
ncbi:chemosensory receptor A [Elysia marginata]|uniref:Chemosensory receptor A n=1 Tax=Elysia marginata TaxID=1093978 RepID=A0AAV4JQA9_9GAST|nr:chemosensory receptor A [Elysia marginata]